MATSTETLKMILSADDRSSSILGRVGLSIGAITAALAGLAAAVKHVANLGDELDKMSIKTGVAVESLSALKLAAELNDSSLSDLQIGIQIMQRNLSDAVQGVGEAKRALDEFGFSQEDLKKFLSDGALGLEQLAVGLFRVSDPGRRAALAMDIFGRSGAQLLPLLQDLAQRGMKGLREESDRLGVTWTKQMTEASQRFNDSLTRVGASMSSLKIRFIAPLIQSLADLGDKLGLGGPQAQKKIELESRLSAIEGIRLRLNQQLQVAADMREKGVRTGIASDAIFNKMVQTGNDLIAERSKLVQELRTLEGKKTEGAGITDPAAARIIEQVARGLDVLQQRISELFKAGVAPATEEFRRMFETIRQAEILARAAFGINVPESLQKSFTETQKWISELTRASGIDTTSMLKDLPPLLQQASSAGSEVRKVFDETRGIWKLINAEATSAAATVADELGGWTSRLGEFGTETKKIDLPKTLDEWKKGTEGYAFAINTLTGQQFSYNLTLAETVRLTNELTRGRSRSSATRSLSEDLKRQKLTTNEPD